MNRRIQMLALLVLVSLFCFGFEGVLLKDYKTENQDEKEIVATLIGFEEGYNKHDAEKALSYLSDEVQFMPCGSHTKLSKKDYGQRLPYHFRTYATRTDYNPKIEIAGDNAFVDLNFDVTYSGRVYTADYKYTLKKEKDKWLILATDHSNERLKKED